ncbi:MAG: zinc-ribbon and DUF3426 domain-containing protein [Leptothrix sp. (in: b-proteobacteria)]
MSLATACPSCSTVFRVAQDQLKASEGWVRCGHCQKVFNAVEHLFDLDSRRSVSAGPRRGGASASESDDPNWQETAPAAFSNENLLRQSRAMRSNVSANSPAALRQPDPPTPPIPPSPDTSSRPPEEASTSRPDTGWGSAAFDFELPAGRKAPPAPPPSAPAPAEPRPAARDTSAVRVTPPQPVPPAAATPAQPSDEAAPSLFAATAAFAPDELLDPLMQEVPHHSTTAVTGTQPGMAQMLARQEIAIAEDSAAMLSSTASRPAPLGANATLPRFVRDADRRARWQRPWVRIVLSLLALLLLSGLAAQSVYQMRDRVAARWPQSKPLLQSACVYLACQIKPPRLIDAIVVDNTALTRPPGVDGYRLSVVLRNRAEHIVAAPHLELNLTDTTGAVVVKRVFSPADFRISQAELAAQSEITWTLAFQVTGQNIAGYTLSAFYP